MPVRKVVMGRSASIVNWRYMIDVVLELVVNMSGLRQSRACLDDMF